MATLRKSATVKDRSSESGAASAADEHPARAPGPTTDFRRADLRDAELVDLYEALLLPRLVEEKALKLLRQGKLSKWFSGIGQEAIAVGVTKALRSDDWILPLHRNLGVFTARGLPLARLFAQWQGKATGYTKGRDRSFHFGTPADHLVGMISHLGAMLGVADGLALAATLDRRDQVIVVFSGDGGTSEGDFHEAVNVAAVWDLPVIFLIENNGYGLSTPAREQFRCGQMIDKAVGYGIEGVQVDGNNILDVFHATRALATTLRRQPKPVLLEALTFRMRGHEEASGSKYVPPRLLASWAEKDPLRRYEQWLLGEGLLGEARIAALRATQEARIQTAWDEALGRPEVVASVAVELADVHAPAAYELVTLSEPSAGAHGAADARPASKRRFIDALADGLRQGMERDPGLVLMGQDVAEYGGVFKLTEGFVATFGKERVRNTPLCESAILGAGLGLAIAGRASVVEMQFADFVACGFNQIVNNLAKTHYRWSQSVNVTVRMPTGAGTAAGPFHSQSNEAWFTHVPGLKVVYPATPYDAKGLLTSALREPNPVMFFEHKLLYRSIEALIPDDYYNVAIGPARVAQAGERATLVTYGAGVHWALALARDIAGLEIIDLRTLLPWDRETVFASVQKTGRCLVLHEDTLIGGFGGELAAAVGEHCFAWLDAPVMRVGALDTPVPFAPALEKQFLPQGRLAAALAALLAY